MAGDFSVDLDLATICNGELNEDFKVYYQDVMGALKKGEQGKVTINVTIKRLPDMDTIVGVEYDIKSQKPSKKRTGVASLVDRNGVISLKTDKPVNKVLNISMFNEQEG